MNFSIELPPKRTGDVSEDISQLYSFLEDMIDELEYLFSEVSNEK